MMSSPLPTKKVPRKGCSGQNIKVFVRCRPMNTQEKLGRSHSLVECQGGRDVIVRERPHDKFSKTFSFDRVFAADSKQLDVYKCVAKPLVDEVLNGFNCTIFAYGQTGTGKTFTMEGERTADCTTWQEDPLAGIIPRCVNHLFDELRIQKLEFTMRVSFLELYNEEVFDLLSAQDDLSKLRLYEDSSRKGSCIIQGLEEVLVRSKGDVYSVIEKGSAKRQTAATLMNAHSSRSHTVFTVTIHIKENTLDGDELLKTGKLHLVDLAGSENIGRSGAVDKRAREAGNINQSLLTLGRVITSLVEKAPHVPYRESKLTRLLQDALGGRTKTSIIATVSPASINLEETLSTLDYAHRAKNITNKPEVNQKLNKKELIGEYTEEIERLRLDLLAMREKNGVYLANENYQEMVDTMEQQAKEITHKIEHIRTIEMELDSKTELFEEVSQQLSETSEKLEKTETQLIGTKQSLHNTQTLLHNTAQDRDEQKYLVIAHKKTEVSLQSQGKALINTADTTTSHINLLHEKIARKSKVEEHNREKSTSFERQFSSSLSSMQSALDQFKEKHHQAITSHVSQHGTAMESLESSVTGSLTELSSLGGTVTTLLGALQQLMQQASSSSKASCQSLSEGLSSHSSSEAARLQQYHSTVLLPLLDNIAQLVQQHTHVTHNIRTTVADMSLEWQKSCECFHEQQAASSAAIVKQLQQQLNDFEVEARANMETSSVLRDQTTQHKQAVDARLDRLMEELVALRESQTQYCGAVTSYAQAVEEKQMETVNEAKAEHKQLIAYIEGEGSRAQQHLSDSSTRQQRISDQINDLAQQALSKVEEVSSLSSEAGSSVQQQCVDATTASLAALAQQHQHRHLEMVSQADDYEQQIKQTIQTGDATVSSTVQSQCSAGSSAVQAVMEHSAQLQSALTSLAATHADTLADHAIQLMDRQGEVQQLFREKMVQDVPTGQTPVRQEYPFSRSLSATSPHQRLLQRYRAASSTQVAARVPLPVAPDNELDSASFSSLDNSSMTEDGSLTAATDSILCSDAGGSSPSQQHLLTARAASMLDVRADATRGGFAVPAAPLLCRLNSREDAPSGAPPSGIPAPVRPTSSAPVSRSSSVSSLNDSKENRFINGNSNSKKNKNAEKQALINADSNSTSLRTRRVLGSQN